MGGADRRSRELSSCADVEARIRPDEPLRTIRAIVDESLESLSWEFGALCATRSGRPPTPREMLLQADLDLAYGRSDVAVNWIGFDRMDKVSGTGAAGLLEDGTREIAFDCDNGDDAVARAEPAGSTKAC